MEMDRVFRLSRQRHTTTSVSYNIFKMDLTEGAISQYVLLLQNSGMHTHTEFGDELGISENTYTRRFGELEKAGLLQVLDISSVSSKSVAAEKKEAVVVLDIGAVYENQLKVSV